MTRSRHPQVHKLRSVAHLTKDCTAAEVPREKRPCWKCGKPGHIGAQCTSAAAKLVDHAQAPGFTFSPHCGDEDEEGSKLAKRTVRPQRVPVTIANFMDVSSFKDVERQKERKYRNKQKVKSVKFCDDFKAECDNTLISQSFLAIIHLIVHAGSRYQ